MSRLIYESGENIKARIVLLSEHLYPGIGSSGKRLDKITPVMLKYQNRGIRSLKKRTYLFDLLNLLGILIMKFFCDDNLGKLAKWLRTLGYDTLFRLTIEDGELVSLALKENRIILSRDTKLSRFKIKDKYLLIQSEKPLEQLKQVMDHFKLEVKEDLLFSRCLLCNKPLQKVEKEKIKDRLYPYVHQTQENFVYCSVCDKIYWSATHVERMTEKLAEGGII